jgi:hypothetical protein
MSTLFQTMLVEEEHDKITSYIMLRPDQSKDDLTKFIETTRIRGRVDAGKTLRQSRPQDRNRTSVEAAAPAFHQATADRGGA